MAKSCMVNREIKRMRMVNKFSSKRTELKAIVKNTSLSDDERRDAREKLNKLPKLLIKIPKPISIKVATI